MKKIYIDEDKKYIEVREKLIVVDDEDVIDGK